MELSHVLMRDQADVGVGLSSAGGRAFKQDPADLQEEQGWVARMIHLLKADSLDVQYEVCSFVALLGRMTTECSVSNSYYKPHGGTSPKEVNG